MMDRLPCASAFVVPMVLLASSAASAPQFDRKLSKEKRADHALNRLTFGPNAADLAAIKKMGVEKWIDLQLHPERLKEDPALEKRLALYSSLTMSASELIEHYPPPQVLASLIRTKNLEDIKDPVLRERAKRYAERKQGEDGRPSASGRRKALDRVLTLPQLQTLRDGTPEEKRALFESLTKDQREKLMPLLPGSARNEVMHSSNVSLRREALAAISPVQAVYHDLTESKILRAVYSTHQLEELMVDFWFNHFNVFFDKGFDRVLVTGFERDAIRPHVLGNFKDLLLATARHPAMLFYLDNWTSVSPEAVEQLRNRARSKKAVRPQGRAAGLNENYARELLELHTMGVDSGYTQNDVTEVARAFTGWSIGNLRDGPRFEFRALTHDRGKKTFLGHELRAGRGEEDALEIIGILAKHPATAKFISQKLARRFVADQPPAALIDRMAAAFIRSNGGIRETMRTMLASPEFWSEGAYRAKLKMPLEFIVSAIRTTDARVDSTFTLNQTLQALGQPLYKKVEPTGYYPLAEEWTNSAALLARMNFGVDLAANKVKGLHLEMPAAVTGTTIGGPEFQRR